MSEAMLSNDFIICFYIYIYIPRRYHSRHTTTKSVYERCEKNENERAIIIEGNSKTYILIGRLSLQFSFWTNWLSKVNWPRQQATQEKGRQRRRRGSFDLYSLWEVTSIFILCESFLFPFLNVKYVSHTILGAYRLRKAKKEEKEAEQYGKELGLGDSNSLEQMILARQQQRAQGQVDFLSHLEAKYTQPKKKKGSKQSK